MRKKIKELRERAKAQGGFTLVELMIVLVILVLIIAVAIPVMGNIMGNAEDSSYESSVGMVEKAAEVAYSDAKLQGADSTIAAKNHYTVKELIDGGFLDLDLTDGKVEYGDSTKYIANTDTVVRGSQGGSFDFQGDEAGETRGSITQ